jgi:hypothetical protein
MKTHFFKFRNILKNRKKGSAIVLVMILSIALMIILASQLDRGVTSKKINLANSLYYEAKNAAESFAEYGCAEVIELLDTQTSISAATLSPPSDFDEFYTDSNIDLAKSSVFGGKPTAQYELYIDPNDPRWEFDPLKGSRVQVMDINIYSKAVASSINLSAESTAYVQQTLQVRDSSLFTYAIFYNMDLELHPGATMNISGPVHSNMDAWVQTSASLTFNDAVSASKRILHGNPRDPKNVHYQTNNVYFKNADGVSIGMMLSGGTSDAGWLDHKQADWREKASQKWDGNVQDSAHNVPVYNAAGIASNVPDNPYTAASELENHAYAVIEPILFGSHPDRKTATVRNQKMEAKACIVFKVELDSTTETGFRIKAYKWARTNTSLPLNSKNPFDDLTVDSNKDPILVEIQIPNRTLFPSLTGDLIGAASADMTIVDNSTDFTNTQAAQPEVYEYSSGVTRGLYDRRQEFGISPVSIDVGVLRQVVDDNANAVGTNLGETYWKDSAGDITFNPVTDWNGVIYVEFPLEDNSGDSIANIVPAKNNMTVTRTPAGGTATNTHTVYLALQIINGEFIPSPTTKDTEKGLTIATNAPVYLVGNYNADGNSTTGSSINIETAHYKNSLNIAYDEPPAAIMGDSFTMLSNNWKPTNGNNRKNSKNSDDSTRRATQFTEVSAAILTGLKPTIPVDATSNPSKGDISGGAHNFPRFLEDWNVTLTIRTSMVALFESEVHLKGMPYDTDYYHPPTRNWGFNENFKKGIFPPGTPNVRSFRRTTFKDITEAEYDAAK